jgi:hypothetical protein
MYDQLAYINRSTRLRRNAGPEAQRSVDESLFEAGHESHAAANRRAQPSEEVFGH